MSKKSEIYQLKVADLLKREIELKKLMMNKNNKIEIHLFLEN